jgi:hypothetical protein
MYGGLPAISSLVIKPVPVGNAILLPPNFVDEDKSTEDADFAYPLVRAFHPAGFAAHADVCTGRWGAFMQGHPRHQ